jgi:hypothetical protein
MVAKRIPRKRLPWILGIEHLNGLLPSIRIFLLVASLVFFWIARCDGPRVWIEVTRIIVVIPQGGIRIGALMRGNVSFLIPIPV